VAYDIKQSGMEQYFKVKLAPDEDDEIGGTDLGSFMIKLPGVYNVYNALSVIAAAIELGVSLSDIRKHLSEFRGASRRMELLGKFHGADIYDDYAHHPTELKAAIFGLRQAYPEQKITAVFHPHTYSRTQALLEDFALSFTEADKVIILDIYGSAREKAGGVHSEDLTELINKKNIERGIKQEVIYIPDLKQCEEYLRKNLERKDTLLLLGAGDVFRVGEGLVNS